MSYLLDTSILARLANENDADHILAVAVVEDLHRKNEALWITPQNIAEFWNVASRPTVVNGLGLPVNVVSETVRQFEARFAMAPESPDIYLALMQIVDQVQVIGKQIHDARLVAVCHVHRLSRILTFNARHFERFAAVGPGLEVVDPRRLASGI
jgi:predicted nucleic acid-binding protein